MYHGYDGQLFNPLRWLIYIFNLVDITKLKLHLASDDQTVFALILTCTLKYTSNCEWSINTKDCLFFANK